MGGDWVLDTLVYYSELSVLLEGQLEVCDLGDYLPYSGEKVCGTVTRG